MNDQTTVEKAWGKEIWFANNDLYCGKIIYVKKDEWSSKGRFHYHKIKDETFYVIDGILILDVEVEPKKVLRYELERGQSIRVFPEQKHRFTGKENCTFIEVSTTHREEDSIRCDLD